MKQRHDILGLAHILIEVGGGGALSTALKIINIDELVRMRETGICHLKVGTREDVVEITKITVAPAVKLGNIRARASLPVQIDGRHSVPNEPCKQALIKVTELGKGLVLDNRRKLVMITNEAYTLESCG